MKERYDLTLNEVGKWLERNNLIIDAVGRLGTAEITRTGMGEKDMEKLARFIHRALNGEGVEEEVKEFRKRFGMRFVN